MADWKERERGRRSGLGEKNLVSTAVRKCAEDDQFAKLKSKPTNDELRGRVIDYLNSVVREKKKRAEMKVKSIKSRTARVSDCITPYHCPCFAYRGFILQFRVWLVNNWESTSLDACKEETS